MFTKPLPRFVIAKKLAAGNTAFYFTIPTHHRKLGCSIPNEPLGDVQRAVQRGQRESVTGE